jgi:hypothetical protein
LKIFVLFASLLLFVTTSFSQTSQNGFNALVSFGLGFSSDTKFFSTNYVTRGIKLIQYNPKMSGKVGIAYESFAELLNLDIGASIEIGYFSSATSSSNQSPAQAQAEQIVIPVTINLLLSNGGKLSPLLKIGFGMGNKTYKENFENRLDLSMEVKKWFFIATGGTGLKYQLSESLDISLLFEVIFLSGSLYAENEIGWISGYEGLQMNTYSGIQFSYSF